MSDLQISLIIIGAVIIVGIVVFNRIQLARYHRKVQNAFKQEHDDVLLREGQQTVSGQERIEPQFGDEIPLTPAEAPISSEPTQSSDQELPVEEKQASSSLEADSQKKNTASVDAAINYVANIVSDNSISHERFIDLLQQKFDFGKPVYWFGQQAGSQEWEEIALDTVDVSKSYTRLKGCVQLADRSGPVSEINLSRFRDMVEDFASQVGATAECQDITEAHTRAVELDKFCADVDVIMGINIISKDGGAFVGTKIRALAEASGFRLESEGVFRYRDDETNEVLFSLGNFESTPFSPANMRTLTTHGITFLLDVPRVPNGEKVFDQMAHIARLFSSTLNGILVDDNRVPLSDNGVKRSRQQLVNIQTLMATQNIVAGSDTALKLFD